MGSGNSKDQQLDHLFSLECASEQERRAINELFMHLKGDAPLISLESFEQNWPRFVSFSVEKAVVVKIYHLLDETGNKRKKKPSSIIDRETFILAVSSLRKGGFDACAAAYALFPQNSLASIANIVLEHFTKTAPNSVPQALYQSLDPYRRPVILTQQMSSSLRYSFMVIVQDNIRLGEWALSYQNANIANAESFAQVIQNHILAVSLVTSLWKCFFVAPFYKQVLASAPFMDGSKHSLLQTCDIFVLQSAVPENCRSWWRQIYSSQLHGQSWQQFVSQISSQGATLIIVRDSGHNVFGGFASQAWTLRPQFYGDRDSFLFQLQPKLQIFTSTGLNDHFQYLNSGTQSLPNGLGMGGQLDYFAFWMDSTFSVGHCRGSPSTTFGNPVLCSEKDIFHIDSVEAWAVRPPTHDEWQDVDERASAMARNPEAKALLEMANRPLYAQYEPEPEPSSE